MVAVDCAEIADDRQTDRKRREEELQSGKLEKTKQKSNQRGRICTAVKRAVATQKKRRQTCGILLAGMQTALFASRTAHHRWSSFLNPNCDNCDLGNCKSGDSGEPHRGQLAMRIAELLKTSPVQSRRLNAAQARSITQNQECPQTSSQLGCWSTWTHNSRCPVKPTVRIIEQVSVRSDFRGELFRRLGMGQVDTRNRRESHHS